MATTDRSDGRQPPTALPQVFTTGQVARICRVAPRTVSKWHDSGKLVGYRLPGSQDRRIPRDELVAFLLANKMPLGVLADVTNRVLMVSVTDPLRAMLLDRLNRGGYCVRVVEDVFAASVSLWKFRPHAVIVDTVIGTGLAASVAKASKEASDEPPLMACVVGDDVGGLHLFGGSAFDKVVWQTADPVVADDVVRSVAAHISNQRAAKSTALGGHRRRKVRADLAASEA